MSEKMFSICSVVIIIPVVALVEDLLSREGLFHASSSYEKHRKMFTKIIKIPRVTLSLQKFV